MTLMNVLKYLWMNISEIIFSVSVVVLSLHEQCVGARGSKHANHEVVNSAVFVSFCISPRTPRDQ